MSTQTPSRFEALSQMEPGTSLAFTDVSWDECQDVLEQAGEASHLRISFDSGALQVMTLSDEHESYASFLRGMITAIQLRLRTEIRSFGSMTLRNDKVRKGCEPDACFYIQNAHLIRNRLKLDLRTDPPPDIAVEVEIHHDSTNNMGIYAALGVLEIWRYNGRRLTMHLLEQGSYQESEKSLAPPFLTRDVISNTMARLSTAGETAALVAFDEWLQKSQPGNL
ncbi:MAG TPA: Uma2 family endonuclease [Blastocatellia bacterium]